MTICVGPCECGGYGVLYDEKAQQEMGTCHDELDVVLRGAPPVDNRKRRQGQERKHVPFAVFLGLVAITSVLTALLLAAR